jgi:hypothetical protein
VRFFPPLAASAAIVVGSPFVGEIRGAIRAAFPVGFTALVGGCLAIAVGLAAVLVLWRVRDRRRLALVGSALAAGVVSALAVRSGDAEVDAVERFHFLEYGALAWLFYRAWRPRADPAALLLPVAASLMVAVADEWVQWFVPSRVGELRDVLLDGAAIACGLVASVGLAPPSRLDRRFRPGSRARVGALGLGLVVSLAVFIHSVHMGHWIDDPEVGAFQSRYTRAALTRLRAARAERWAETPPLPAPLLSREDQYLDEAMWHVRARNRAWAALDVGAAWRENLILERYYTPVLALRTGAADTSFAWPPAQRIDAEARGGAGTAAYISRAPGLPIYTWSPGPFWLAVVVLMAGIAGGTWRSVL